MQHMIFGPKLYVIHLPFLLGSIQTDVYFRTFPLALYGGVNAIAGS